MTRNIGTDAIITRIRTQEQSSDPSAPATGYGYLYEKIDQQLYLLNASGTASNLYHYGTSFPGSPKTKEIFFRTDRNLEYYYDGTRWLSLQIFRETFFPSDNANPTTTSGAALGAWPTRQGDNGIYVLTVEGTTLVSTTNNGSNYWTVAFNWRTQGNANTELANFNTSGDTATNWYDHSTTVNAVLDSTARYLNCVVTKTAGAPGSIYVYPSVSYRLIG